MSKEVRIGDDNNSFLINDDMLAGYKLEVKRNKKFVVPYYRNEDHM